MTSSSVDVTRLIKCPWRNLSGRSLAVATATAAAYGVLKMRTSKEQHEVDRALVVYLAYGPYGPVVFRS